jgi:hypothetical protein
VASVFNDKFRFEKQNLIKMRIKVKVKDIELEVDDNDSNTVVKYESHNNEVQKTIKVMCEQAMILLKERLMFN